jgi:hypothetical protein
MKKLCSAALIFSFASMASGQVFEKTYGSIDDDRAYSVSLCDDGCYLVAGYTTEFFSGYDDIYLLKLDAFGDTVWTRQEGETYGIETAYCVNPTADQGCIIAASRYATGQDIVPYILKYDQFGNKEWDMDYGDTFESGYAWHALQSSDTTFAVCGTSAYYDATSELWGQKAFVMSINPSGEKLWDLTKGGAGVHYAGGMVMTADGGLVVGGEYDTPGEFTDAWIFKVTAAGNSQWNKTIGGDQSTESAWDIKVTPDGGFILLGNYFEGIILMNADMYLVKTDGSGNVEWTQTYGTPWEDDRGASVDITLDGGYILCGETESFGTGNKDVLLIRTDENGDTLWTRTFGGVYGDEGNSVKATPDGGFIIAGMTENNTAGGTDVYVIRTNFLGTLVGTPEHQGREIRARLYPNPVENLLYLAAEEDPVSFRIITAQGRVLHSEIMRSYSSREPIADLSGLPKGVYTIRLQFKSGESAQKIFKN